VPENRRRSSRALAHRERVCARFSDYFFTEDFFLPVTAVLEREGRLVELARLWGVTLAFNLVGVLIFALLISRPGVLDSGPTDVLIGIAERKVDYNLSTAFIKALFAGWLMTLLTWLIVAAEGFGAKLVIVWIVGSLIVLAEFNHDVISASEIWIAMLSGGSINVREWFTANFLPSLTGNILGGFVFVTLLHFVQALAQVCSESHDA
jgi:formate/nitrite transporter FocA (FNT family)